MRFNKFCAATKAKCKQIMNNILLHNRFGSEVIVAIALVVCGKWQVHIMLSTFVYLRVISMLFSACVCVCECVARGALTKL